MNRLKNLTFTHIPVPWFLSRLFWKVAKEIRVQMFKKTAITILTCNFVQHQQRDFKEKYNKQ